MGYSGWLARYLADPAAVDDGERGHSAPSKQAECTAVRLTFRVQCSSRVEVAEALQRLAPPGTVAFGPERVDGVVAGRGGRWCATITYNVDWEWAES